MREKMILLLEDKLGVSSGYEKLWQALLVKTGIDPTRVLRLNLHETLDETKLLVKRGTGKSLVFNPDPEVSALVFNTLRDYLRSQEFDVKLILCQDAAALGLVTPEWRDATIDKLRGGVYNMLGTPCVVIPPVSALNTYTLQKDVKLLNQGYESEEEMLLAGADEYFNHPYQLKAGEWILMQDLRKAARVFGRTV